MAPTADRMPATLDDRRARGLPIQHRVTHRNRRSAGSRNRLLDGLHATQLGPEVHPHAVADAMDQVAEECSPFADVSEVSCHGSCRRPALVWGGSVLAARASRRLAEALRPRGRAALAADADGAADPGLHPTAWPPFADPFEDQISVDQQPTLVLLDDARA